MNAHVIKLILSLYSHNIEISLYGTDQIRYRPQRVVNVELCQQLKEYKSQLIEFLHHLNAPESAPPAPLNIWGRCASAVLTTVNYTNLRVIYRKDFEQSVASYENDGNHSPEESERLGFFYLLHVMHENASEERYMDANQGICNYWYFNPCKDKSL